MEVSYPRSVEERAQDAPIQEKFKDAHNIDSIFISAPGWPAGSSMERYEEYVDHTRENGFTALSNTVTNGGESAEVVVARMKVFNQFLADHSDRFLQIKRIGEFEKTRTGQQIGVFHNFLNSQGTAYPMDIAKHMEYVKNLAGAEAVCAGSDYVYNCADSVMMILKNPEKYPPESGYATPSHMGMPGEIWGAVRLLQEVYGWTDDEIRGLLGENLLRVYGANWAPSKGSN